jgi:molecular chaperone DnaK
VESALSSLKEALNGTEIDEIKNATDSLLKASQGFSQRLYEEAAKANSDSSGAAAPQGNDDEIVDAEIVD